MAGEWKPGVPSTSGIYYIKLNAQVPMEAFYLDGLGNLFKWQLVPFGTVAAMLDPQQCSYVGPYAPPLEEQFNEVT